MALSKIDSDGIVANGITADSLNIGQIGGRRNLIINGAMQVAQRGTSATGKTGEAFDTADRWYNGVGSYGTWTSEQSTDAPTGFSNSLKLTCTSSASLSAGSYVRMLIGLEGQDLQHLSFGTSSAKQLTLSFWVKSNKTGTMTAFARRFGTIKVAGGLVSISSADTWEYKTVTINGDTVTSMANDNGLGMQIQFWFNAGSTYSGGTLTNSFTSSDANKYYSTGTLGLGGATSDYVAITGVQLEVGSVATPFEHRSYGEELALCKRYYQTSGSGATGAQVAIYGRGNGTASSVAWLPLPVQMRSSPTSNTNISSTEMFSVAGYGAGTATVSAYAGTNRGMGAYLLIGGLSGGTDNRPNYVVFTNELTLDAEL